jgi:hypothetical protein
MVFAGSTVTKGRGRCVITSTGMATELGSLSFCLYGRLWKVELTSVRFCPCRKDRRGHGAKGDQEGEGMEGQVVQGQSGPWSRRNQSPSDQVRRLSSLAFALFASLG